MSEDARTERTGAVSIAGISKRYGDVTAVHALDLEIPAGSFFSLLGPSGCGKTTLLKIVAGLETPDTGTLSTDGTDITGRPPERRPFNMVFQHYALFPHMTVADNVGFGLTTQARAERPSVAERAERVAAMLRLVSLERYGSRYPSELSGGQAQRVAVARAVMNRPKLLIADEPTSNLDDVHCAAALDLLEAQAAECGATLVVATHDARAKGRFQHRLELGT